MEWNDHRACFPQAGERSRSAPGSRAKKRAGKKRPQSRPASCQHADGLDDQWEFRHFGDKTIADPQGNPDGDDLTNAEEYIAGTNPNLPESFEISNLIADGAVQLEWDAVDGRLYNVYWSSNLVGGFTLVGSNLVDGLFIDSNANQELQGFYKITVEREP